MPTFWLNLSILCEWNRRNLTSAILLLSKLDGGSFQGMLNPKCNFKVEIIDWLSFCNWGLECSQIIQWKRVIIFLLFFNIWFYYRHWQRFFVASFVWRSWGMPISVLIVPSYVVMCAFADGSQNNVHNALTVEHHYIFMNWSTVAGLKRWHSSWIHCKQLG